MVRVALFAAALWGFLAGPALAGVDLSKIDRRIVKEPKYQSGAPQYCLVVFGPEALTRVWIVRDGETAYVDCNGNGDLTEEGKRFKLGQGGTLENCVITAKHGVAPKTQLEMNLGLGPQARIYCSSEGGTSQRAGSDGHGRLNFGTKPENAPIVHFQGELSISPDEPYTLQRGDEPTEFYVFLGTPGLGAGTFACIGYGEVPKDVHPVAEIEFPAKTGGAPPIKLQVMLDHRC